MNSAILLATAIGQPGDVTFVREKPRVLLAYSATSAVSTSFSDCEQWLNFDASTGILTVENPVLDLVGGARNLFEAALSLPINVEMEAEADRVFRERRDKLLGRQIAL